MSIYPSISTPPTYLYIPTYLPTYISINESIYLSMLLSAWSFTICPSFLPCLPFIHFIHKFIHLLFTLFIYYFQNKTKLAERKHYNGTHGWDNSLMSMKPIFLASGPNFKRNVRFGPIRNVDIYPLMCELMGIPPGPTNGSLERVIDFLVPFQVNGARSVDVQWILLLLVPVVLTYAHVSI